MEIRSVLMSLILHLFVLNTLVFGAPSGEIYDEDHGERAGFKRSAVRTTVVNLNDSNTDDLFRNFNVSKDEIYRRMAQKTAGETPAPTTDNSNADESSKRNEQR